MKEVMKINNFMRINIMTMKKITMNEEQNNDKKFWLLVGLGAV